MRVYCINTYRLLETASWFSRTWKRKKKDIQGVRENVQNLSGSGRKSENNTERSHRKISYSPHYEDKAP